MTAVYQHETTLWSLKLGGMLDTLDVRPSPLRGNSATLEFLEVLCEDELNQRGVTRRYGAWTLAQTRQSGGFDPVSGTISAGAPGCRRPFDHDSAPVPCSAPAMV